MLKGIENTYNRGEAMKRILHVISQYPGSTGSGIYLREVMREASKKGYKQGLVAGFNQVENLGLDKLYPIEFKSEALNFPIVGMSDEMPYETRAFKDLTGEEYESLLKAYKERLIEAIEDFKPDLIISHHLWLISSMIKDLVPEGLPVVGICHGTDIRQLRKDPSYKPRVIEGIGKLDHIFSLSHNQAKEIRELYLIPRERISVLGGGYNRDIFYPGPMKSQDRLSLIYGGKISYAKGLKSLLRAFEMIYRDYNVELKLAGSGLGDQYEDIRSYSESFGGRVRFLGNLDQADLAEEFRKSDIFIMPSFYEGLSLVTIEAMSSGLLVVSNELDGLKSFLPEEIKKSGLIKFTSRPKMISLDRPREDKLYEYEESLARTIVEQIENLDKRLEMYEEARSQIESLSWAGLFRRIEGEIELL